MCAKQQYDAPLLFGKIAIDVLLSLQQQQILLHCGLLKMTQFIRRIKKLLMHESCKGKNASIVLINLPKKESLLEIIPHKRAS